MSMPRSCPFFYPASIADTNPFYNRSFDYGDYDPVTKTGGQPFVQLLSTTDRDASWTEFKEARAKALKSLPPAIDPADFSNDQEDSDGTLVKTSGAVAVNDTLPDDLTSVVKKYGPVVIGLLAGNVLVGILLLLVGITVSAKGLIRSGERTRSLGAA